MKKLLLTLALGVFVSSTVCARKVSETYYGATKGGFAISFGADPVINFVGNMFNGTSNQKFDGFKGLGSDLFNGATISGKYMLEDDLALTLGLGFNNESEKKHEYNDSYDLEEKTSVETNASHNFMMLVGAQKLLRPGKRLQPVLGLNLAYCYSNANYTRNNDKVNDVTVYRGHPAHTLGLLANVGVEYFVARNISLSATVDLGICKTWTKGTYDNSDNDENNYSRVEYSNYKLKTGQFGGNLAMNFYF